MTEKKLSEMTPKEKVQFAISKPMTREEHIERLKLTDEEFFEWCGSHTVKGCNSSRLMDTCEREVSRCEDCRIEAQLDKIFNDPHFAVVDRGGAVNLDGQPSISREACLRLSSLLGRSEGIVAQIYAEAQRDLLNTDYLKEIKEDRDDRNR